MSDAQPFPTNFAEPKLRSKRQNLFIASVFAVALAMVVVVLGAFTRLSDAGLGCPDWPGCYGHLTWPKTAEDVAAAEARFPEAPVEHDKTWPEMVHRYFAGTLGLVIFSIAWLVWRERCLNSRSVDARRIDARRIDARRDQRHATRLPLGLPLFLAALVVLQGAFGAWTVTLKLWPQVVTAHLLGGFATASCLWLLALRLSSWRFAAVDVAPWLKALSVMAMAAVVVQIALGGWTSANYAALACPDLPTCHGVWWPPADFLQGFNIFQHVGPNYLGGLLDNHARTAIHLSHRIGAVTVSLVLVALAICLLRLRDSWSKKIAAVLLVVLVFQVTLGVSNVFWVLPLPVAVAHNAFGLVLLMVLVTVNYGLRNRGVKSHV